MAFFDFHLHPFFKHFMTGYHAADREDLLEPIVTGIPAVHAIVDSQSSPTFLKGAGNIFCAALMPMERGFAKSWVIQKIGPRLTPLSGPFLADIAAGTVSYFQLLNQELDYITENRERLAGIGLYFPAGNGDVKKDKTNIVFSVEGAHSFIDFSSASPLENFSAFLERLERQQYRLLYLTLTHLTRIREPDPSHPGQQQAELATFSYAMKLLKDEVFYPRGKGITSQGLELINACYDAANPVYVDVKHMSLLSRLELYELRKAGRTAAGKPYAGIPLVGTHMGVNGWRLDDYFRQAGTGPHPMHGCVAVKIRQQIAGRVPRGLIIPGALRKDIGFNPWTVNLFDDEIEWIVASGGLIGISLDQRILGFVSDFSDATHDDGKEFGYDFISGEEWQELVQRYNVREELAGDALEETEAVEAMQLAVRKRESVNVPEALEVVGTQTFNKKIHTFHFCATLIHILTVSARYYEQHRQLQGPAAFDAAWQHVAIGSDFDGFIDPLNGCRDATEFEAFRIRCAEQLHAMAEAYYKRRQPGDLQHYLGGGKIDARLGQLFHTNGSDFVKR